MGQIAAADETLIYRIFGIDGELLIDHAWGRETATIEDIKGYSPKACCVSSGQVLPKAYGHGETEQIVKEMTDQLCLELVERRLVTDSIAPVSYTHLDVYKRQDHICVRKVCDFGLESGIFRPQIFPGIIFCPVYRKTVTAPVYSRSSQVITGWSVSRKVVIKFKAVYILSLIHI